MTEEQRKMIEPIFDSFENEDIKQFCRILVDNLPLYWWEVPAHQLENIIHPML